MDFGVNGRRPTFFDRIFGRHIVENLPANARPYITTEDGTSVLLLDKLKGDPEFNKSMEEVDRAFVKARINSTHKTPSNG